MPSSELSNEGYSHLLPTPGLHACTPYEFYYTYKRETRKLLNTFKGIRKLKHCVHYKWLTNCCACALTLASKTTTYNNNKN